MTTKKNNIMKNQGNIKYTYKKKTKNKKNFK